MDKFDDSGIHVGHVLLGGMMMALGALFLLDRLQLLGPSIVGLWFPLILIAFGLSRIIWPSRRSPVAGVWIGLAGGLLLLDRLNVVTMHESWPVFVIMAGVLMIFRAVGWLPGRRDRAHWNEVPR